MKVMVIVKATKESEAGEMPSEQLLTDMGNYNQELVDAGIMLAGEGLHPSAKGARVRFSGKNRTVTDGPFAETKELIAGFWMWKVNSMEEAIEWVKRCPNPMEGESDIEIRQVFDADDFGAEFTPELREQEAGIRAKAMGLEMRYEDSPELLIAGINQTIQFEERSKIPAQWQQFAPQIGKVTGQVGSDSFGVVWNYKPESGFDYLTGVQVRSANGLPRTFENVSLPAQRYAVFTHRKPVQAIAETMDAIWQKWLPDSGFKTPESPCFERYGNEFNPKSGTGAFEIWVPVVT